MRAFLQPDARRTSCPHRLLPVRPLQRRKRHPRAAAVIHRKAWPSAEVTAEAHRRRRFLPPVLGLLVADAAQGEYPPCQTVYYHFRQ
jgi:hypothetical protein